MTNSDPPAFFVGTRKGLFQLARQKAGEWSPIGHDFVGDPVTQLLHDARDGSLYAALNLGHFGPKLHRLAPGASEWEEIACPAFEESDGASVKEIWALEAGGTDQSGRLWAGTIPGGLFRSDDSGASWELVRSLWDDPGRAKWFGGGADEPAIHSICVHPENSRELIVGVSCGGAWQSRDDGDSWQQVAHGMRAAYLPEEQRFEPDSQDPHMIVRCPAQPSELWCQHHNGIFKRSGDADWTEVTTAPVSAFGFGCVVHPTDSQRAWFVPGTSDQCRLPVDAAVVVQHTRDGGASFEVQREGLPQSHAYDIVLRHALAIDASGERLVFGSTCGGLWVTEDGGQRWQIQDLRLPPVYVVKWQHIER
jgi:hypothetical protein